jgi:cyclophilin family peptidyl-prolyl cis-trans isomerase/mono/diheme cytochrome c family protein
MAAPADGLAVHRTWIKRFLFLGGALFLAAVFQLITSSDPPEVPPPTVASAPPATILDTRPSLPRITLNPPQPAATPTKTTDVKPLETTRPMETSHPEDAPRVGDERLVMHTVGGDIVLAFYPEAAPQNVSLLLKLARVGAYDSTEFGRQSFDTFLELFNLYDRLTPFYDRHVRALSKFPLEKNKLHHLRGAIQMTHSFDKPDDGDGSFSILLNDRPDLDGQYTIAGFVESGMDVVQRLTQVPTTDKDEPAVRLTVIKAEVVPASLVPSMRLRGPQHLDQILEQKWPANTPERPELLAALGAQAPKLLQQKCAQCHNDRKAEGSLDLTTAAGVRRGGAHGRVVFAGNALGSPLYGRVADEDQAHKTVKVPEVTATEGDLLRLWIDRGAPWPGETVPIARAAEDTPIPAEDLAFWSFQPLKVTPPPTVRNNTWPKTPVDRFILAGLEAKQLAPNPQADRRTLARRLWFDLTGLPPNPTELEAFLADASPNAYDKLVDRLLASPRYGERWGRHWLDLARYADSGGYEDDNNRLTAYWYRDFVVRALNEDLPFDTFIRWQVAGDELAPANRWAVVATGFATAGPNQDFRPRIRDRYDELDDMVNTLSTAMLGMTVGCARCHDHKYDPISQADYYRLAAVFTDARREDRYLPTDNGVTLVEALRPLTDRAEVLRKRLREDRNDLRSMAERDQIRAQMMEKIMHWPRALALAGSETSPRAMFLDRGDDRRERDVVSPGFLTATTPGHPTWQADTWAKWAPPSDKSPRPAPRTALANWLTDADQGAGQLAARVIVNRLWQHHLGEGLVATPNDFGKRGAHPSNPQLLDWLAQDLIDNGWQLKRLHRLIVTSAVYQQDTSADPAKVQADPENRLFGRRRPQRLTSDALRDAILEVSGNLNEQMYGPSIKPPIPKDAILPTDKKHGIVWPADAVDGPVNWRRSLYIAWQRSNPMPFLQTFDSPDTSLGCAVRSRTTVPTQALLLMNDPIIRAQAQRFADRLTAIAGKDIREQVRQAFLVALARPPSQAEADKVVRFLEGGKDEAKARQALQDFCQVLFQMNEFMYVD